MLHLSQFIIALIIKHTQQFISIFCKKKKETKLIIFFLKLGDNFNRNLIISSIGISFFELIKDRFGSRIVLQLIKIIPEKKNLFFSIVNYKIFEYIMSKNSCQVIDFLFQNMINKQDKLFMILALTFFCELKYSKFSYKFHNKIFSIRALFSGFSLECKNRLKLLYSNRILLLSKKLFNYASHFASTLLFEFFRFSFTLKKDSLLKIIFKYGLFLSNSCQGILLISNVLGCINIKNLSIFYKRMFLILPIFLRSKHGHIMILLFLKYINLNKKKFNFNSLIDNLFNHKYQSYKYSQYVYLFILNPMSKIFYKKKIYKPFETNYTKNILSKLNKNHKKDLYYLLNRLIKYQNFNNIELVTRRLMENVRFGNNKFLFYFNFIESKSKIKTNLFKQFISIFIFLKHLSEKEKKIDANLFVFYCFDYYFTHYFIDGLSYFFCINFFRCIFFSKIYIKFTIFIEKYNSLKITLPVNLNKQEFINLIVLDRLSEL